MLNLIEDFQIDTSITLEENIGIPITLLPKQYIDGRVLVGKALRCSIEYGKQANKGGYGVITRIKRAPSAGELCVKSPHRADVSLCPEAILQWHTSKTLRAAGIYGAVPHVYDIFQYAGETRFTMDFIDGISAVQAMMESADPDTLWLQILGQVSLILGYLEENIFLDHRDLKADNLWIRQVPIEYTLRIGGHTWHIAAPFQVVILDFGFACLGGENGHAAVSLGAGLVPKIDPCPKEGRDLFQLITSMWSIPTIRERAGSEVQAAIDSLLKNKGASFIGLVHRNLNTHWIYLAVSDSAFRHPPLHPVALLLKLSSGWPAANLTRQ
jgi:serine/threonine protein kinase